MMVKTRVTSGYWKIWAQVRWKSKLGTVGVAW